MGRRCTSVRNASEIARLQHRESELQAMIRHAETELQAVVTWLEADRGGGAIGDRPGQSHRCLRVGDTRYGTNRGVIAVPDKAEWRVSVVLADGKESRVGELLGSVEGAMLKTVREGERQREEARQRVAELERVAGTLAPYEMSGTDVG
eukprot:887309-Rhodomonas_salina.2